MIVAEESYETTEPTIDSHIVKLKSAGADIFVTITTPKFAAQAIKKIAEIEWKPLLSSTTLRSPSAASSSRPVSEFPGHDFSGYLKDPPIRVGQRSRHERVAAFMAKDFPEGDKLDSGTGQATASHKHGSGAQAMRRRPLPRERHEAGGKPKDFEPMLLPGIKINTCPTDFARSARCS